MKIELRTRFQFGGFFVGLIALGGLALYFLEYLMRLACPIKSVTSLQCPGCGSTRCLQAMGRGDLLEALRQNAVVFGATVLVTGYLLLGFITPTAALAIRDSVQSQRRTATWFVLAVVSGFTLLRNIPGAPRA